MKKLELPLHPKLETLFGYSGSAKRVVFYWEPFADKLMYDDGSENGSANSWAYLIWAGHPSVKPHLPQMAGTLLMLERAERRLYTLSRAEALEALEASRGQTVQSLPAPAAPLREAQQLLADFVLWLSTPAAKAA
jgi:hypothetical protein